VNKINLMHELEFLLEIPRDTLKLDKPLNSYFGWNSMTQISLIALFDKYFASTLDYADIESLKTANDILQLAKESESAVV
jgi:acyl carrier protein